MKKLFSLFLFAVLALFSGVILTACCENNENRIITITDASGLSDVRLKIGETYLESENNIYTVANLSNVTVEFNANSYGVDFNDVAITVGKNVLNVETDVFDKGKYDPTPEEGNLYFGYIKLARIEGNINIRIDGLKIVTTTFNFELENEEDLEDEEIVEKLKMTHLSFATDEDSADDYMTNLHDFLTSASPSVERVFDDREEVEYNTFRVLRVRFDGVQPFNLVDKKLFSVGLSEGENRQEIGFFIGKTYYIDLGSFDIRNRREYTIKVNFRNLEYQEYEIFTPQENSTYGITYKVGDDEKPTVNFKDKVTIEVVKKMAEHGEEGEIYADFSDVVLDVNGTVLEANIDGKYVFENLTPRSTENENERFVILLKNVKYFRVEDGEPEEVETVKLSAYSELPFFSTPLVDPKIFMLVDGQKKEVAGVDDEGEVIGFAGEKHVLAWEYEFDEFIGKYRSMIDLRRYDISLNNDEVIHLGDVLENMTLVSDNVYTSEEFDGLVLRATLNERTQIFDKFELEFVCDIQEIVLTPGIPDLQKPEIERRDYMTFRFFNEELWRKSVDVSMDIENNSIIKIESRIYDYDALVQSNWTTLSANKSVTFNDIVCRNIVEFKITYNSNTALTYTDFMLENERYNSYQLQSEDSVENGNKVLVLRFEIPDDYITASDENMKYKLLFA